MTRKKFPIGVGADLCPCHQLSDAGHDAAHRDLMATKYLPRLRQIAAFFDSMDNYGGSCSLETLLGIREEMFTLLALTWGGQSEAGGDRMIEQILPWVDQLWKLQDQNIARAKAKLEARRMIA